MTRCRSRLVLLCALLLAAFAAFAQPADPQPDPNAPNVFYGAVPPNGAAAPVLVFIHGLGATASYFWTNGNDMYSTAYSAGYRTAFISMSSDNTPNFNHASANAAVLSSSLPYVLANYGVRQIYFVCHSKGGIDTEYAMGTNLAVLKAAKAVFTLSAPNQGDALADWCFNKGKVTCKALHLFNAGMADLRTTTVQAYRAAFDPIFDKAGIPFYTLGRDVFTGSPSTDITGRVLKHLTGEANDGLVTPSESVLSSTYSSQMAIVQFNHYQIGTGSVSFPYIRALLPLP
jgi:triacylglycerol lipase